MLKKTKQAVSSMRGRVGPVGLSLVAAGVTAVAFAGVTMAADNGGGGNSGNDGNGGKSGDRAPRTFHIGPELSDEDRQKLEEFHSCLEENGGPVPPEPGEMRERLRDGIEKDELPEPPTKEEQQQMRDAYEACKDKLPEGAEFGFGVGPGRPGCDGPPPAGVPEGTVIPAPPSGGSQGDVDTVPQGSTS